MSWLALYAALLLSACDGESTYIVAGSISGLSANGLVLQNNGADNLTVPIAASSFQFPTRVPAGDSYEVTVAAQPAGLTCSVGNGSRANVHAPIISNITVSCSARTYALAGTVSGLTTGGLVLQNNAGDSLAVAENAATFQFPAAIAAGSGYKVTVSTQPAGLTCSVSNGVGSKVGANIDSIRVTCNPTTVVVAGTITGLSEAGLGLQANGSDDLTIPANATSFRFPTSIAYGSGYAVTISAQPAGESCSLAGGSGTANSDVIDVVVSCAAIPTFTLTVTGGANGSIAPTGSIKVNSGDSQSFVATPSPSYGIYQWMLDGAVVQTGGDVYVLANVLTNHSVRVTFAHTTLTPSLAALALAINNTTINAALTGTAREVFISNTGSSPATNVSISYPGWPSGTSISSTCGSTLLPAATCSITVTPGLEATSDCTSGVAPTPGVVSITSDESGPSIFTVTVLGYGCLYQGGYVFAIDDTTANTESILGKVAARTDQAPPFPNGVDWAPNGDFFDILGIDENSTVPCAAITDGACNTAQIVAHYSAAAPSSYAAGLCLETIDGYSDWYLPAICELGFDLYTHGSGCGDLSSQLIQNMQANLVGSSNILQGNYWSSTEWSVVPDQSVWNQLFSFNNTGQQYATDKNNMLGVRCARALSN